MDRKGKLCKVHRPRHGWVLWFLLCLGPVFSRTSVAYRNFVASRAGFFPANSLCRWLYILYLHPWPLQLPLGLLRRFPDLIFSHSWIVKKRFSPWENRFSYWNILFTEQSGRKIPLLYFLRRRYMYREPNRIRCLWPCPQLSVPTRLPSPHHVQFYILRMFPCPPSIQAPHSSRF